MLSTKLKEAAGNSADATLYVDDVFSTYLYTGLNATQTITTGIDLATKGGLLWLKGRNVGSAYGYGDHELFDSANVGSTSKYLRSDGSDAISAGGSIDATPFTTTGFNLKAGPQVNNRAGDTTVAWTFRKAAKFFDVVTYTGTGSARTIAHSLGVAPGMVIVKRTDTSSDWQVYSNGLTSAAYSIRLNSTAAQASDSTVWNSTAPTSSVFSVGTSVDTNEAGGTYVAYLFAHDTSSTGIIQCGSFTNVSFNSSVNLGWQPQLVLIKRSDANENWEINDTMRGMSVASDGSGYGQRLVPNTSAAETTFGSVAPTATGFNYAGGSTSTYIYMAIRMPNKPPTLGTQVYNAIARTGTGGAVTVTGAGFAPDLIHPQTTDAYGANAWYDKLRGNSKIIYPSSNIDEGTDASIGTFNQDGFSCTGGAADYSNAVGQTYINHFFKRAPEFFDEVCYTGTGVATTQAHNLTVVPELMIVKQRLSPSSNWWVYVSSVGNTKYSVLNSTAIPVTDSTAWNNTTPTASVFSIGTGVNVNTSAKTYAAYLFATLAGISKVGSYTGNGTGQAIACGFSGGARFVLIKRTDSTGGWYTFDSARGLTVGSSPYLLLNSTAAEVTGNNGVYASTGGFTLGATASTTTNINAATYIYLSVA